MGKGKNGLPDRWLDYISIGQEIRGVPIIACKVPLREGILKGSTRHEDWFTPDNLVEMVPNVGCIVDLTATRRYYNPLVFIERGIHHEKIFCEGHVIPKSTTVQKFFQVVDEFLHSVDSRGKVLMVHCTHGLNRTGYLVSRYMVERRGFLPADAIAAFNEARGHCIERENYLEDLHTRNSCTDPVALFQNSGPRKGYLDHQAAINNHPPEEFATASTGFNRYGGPARRSEPNDQLPFANNQRGLQPHADPRPSYNTWPSAHNQNERYATNYQQQSNAWHQGQSFGNRSHGHPSQHVQHVNQQSSATYQGRTKNVVPPTGYDSRQKHSYYRHVLPPDMSIAPKHIRFTSPPAESINDQSKSLGVAATTHENPAQVINLDERPNSANRGRSRSNVDNQAAATVKKSRKKRSKSPSVQVVDEIRESRSASSASSSKMRDRSANRHGRDVPEDQSTSSIEICYDSRRTVSASGQDRELRRPSTREKNHRDVQSDQSGSTPGQELGTERRPSGKKMRHKVAKRLKEASNGGPLTDRS